MKPLLFAWLFLSLSVFDLSAESLSERSKADLDKFVAAAQKEVAPTSSKAAPALSVDEERYAVNETWMMLNVLRQKTVNADPAQIVEALTQLAAYLKPEALRQQAQTLAIQIEAEQAAAELAQTQETEKTLADAAATVRKATAPADLDKTLEKLAEINARRQELQRASTRSAGLTQRVKNALDFTTEWQTYLSLAQAGSSQTSQVLATLSEHVWTEAIPRSEILAMLHGQRTFPPSSAAVPNSSAEDVIQRIKTPADLSAALDTLSKVVRTDREKRGTEDGAITTTIKTLADLEQAYREFQAGLPTVVDIIGPQRYTSPPYHGLTASVRAQVIALVLPRYLGLPEGVKAQPDEGPYPFLERIGTDAAARGDYLLAAKARDAQRMLRDGQAYGGLDNSQAGQYIIARNQETAGQFALAVANYERALTSASELVPAKAIGERLAAIRAEHPDEFQQGLNNFLAPPVPNYPPDRFRPGYPRPVPPGFGQPYAPAPTPTPPSLAIPAAPAASPKNP